MLIYCADDEPLLLADLCNTIHAEEPDAEVKAFGWANPLLIEMEHEQVKPDIAFLDIEMPGMSGMELARELRRLSPDTSLVFVTGYAQYAAEAFSIHADGYMIKPVVAKALRRELDHIWNKTSKKHRLRVQCFGNFEVFCDEEPITFPRQKSKELFAYLIDRRGAQATMAELASVLWEDGRYDISRNNQIHSFLHDLIKRLEQLGERNVIRRQRNAVAVDVSRLDCDAYSWLAGNPAAIRSFTGEYMQQYSWAESSGARFCKLQ